MIININLNPYSHVVNDCIGYIKHTDPGTREAEQKNFFLMRNLLGIVFEATFLGSGDYNHAVSIIESKVSHVVNTICESPSPGAKVAVETQIANSLRELMTRLEAPIGAFLSRGRDMDIIEDFNIHGGYVIIKLNRVEHETSH